MLFDMGETKIGPGAGWVAMMFLTLKEAGFPENSDKGQVAKNEVRPLGGNASENVGTMTELRLAIESGLPSELYGTTSNQTFCHSGVELEQTPM